MEDRIRSVVLLLILGTVAQSTSYIPDPYNFNGVVLPTITCPPDYVQYNSQCVSSHKSSETTDPIIDCPPGFVMTSTKMCEKSVSTTDVKMPTFECPHDYTYNGYSCVTPTKCSAGYNFDGRQCVKITPTCPTGYSFSGSMCWADNKPVTLPINPVQSHTHNCPYAAQNQIINPCGQYTPCQTPVTYPMPAPCQVVPPPVFNPSPPIAPIFPPVVDPPPPIQPRPVCPPGYKYNGVACVIIITDPTVVPPVPRCPPGFHYKDGQCTKTTITDKVGGTKECPPGYILYNGWCHPPHRPEPFIAPPEHTIERNVTINVHNPVNVPTNINNLNNQTMFVNTNQQSATPPVTAPIGCQTPPCLEEKGDIAEEPKKCCEVVSPRICKRKHNKNWFCYHRKTEQCSSACTAPQIHLRAPRPVYHPMHIVMAPQPEPHLRPRPRPMFYTPPNGQFSEKKKAKVAKNSNFIQEMR